MNNFKFRDRLRHTTTAHVTYDLLQKTMTPGQDQWGRVQTLAGCVLIALAAGTNYVSKKISSTGSARWSTDIFP